MKRPFGIVLFFALVFVMCASVYALDVSDGRIKLVLHQDMGRFSLYYLADPEKKKYISLFVDQDIRTSYLSLLIDNKVVRIGESPQFKEKIEKNDSGATRTWTSDSLDVTEDFRFAASGRQGTDGIKIQLTIRNTSSDKTSVGVRYVFDTYLGERTGVHFMTDKADKMEYETSYDRDNMIQYWISPQEPYKEPVKIGLKMVTKGSDVTTPDKIVFANWKRLSDAAWSYSPPSDRTFSVRPYSINDSAVSVYYNPQTLEKGASMDVVLLLSYYGTGASDTGAKPTDHKKASSTENAKKDAEKEMMDILATKQKKDKERLGSSLSSGSMKIIDDLTTIENLIDEINKILYSGDDISDKDMKLMEQMIAELNERVKKY
jgi:hypothetical protein